MISGKEDFQYLSPIICPEVGVGSAVEFSINSISRNCESNLNNLVKFNCIKLAETINLLSAVVSHSMLLHSLAHITLF